MLLPPTGGTLSGRLTANAPPNNAHAASDPAITSSRGLRVTQPHQHVSGEHLGEKQRVFHPTAPRGRIVDQTHAAGAQHCSWRVTGGQTIIRRDYGPTGRQDSLERLAMVTYVWSGDVHPRGVLGQTETDLG